MANNASGPRAKFGYGYLHNVVDDYSRLAYTEILPDERQDTAAAFWTRASIGGPPASRAPNLTGQNNSAPAAPSV